MDGHGLTALEFAVIEMLLAGDVPELVSLRRQFGRTRVIDRELTGVGFHTLLDLRGGPPIGDLSFELSDVGAELEGVEHGGGFLLYIRDGRIAHLEGFTYGDDEWPDSPERFSLHYIRWSESTGGSGTPDGNLDTHVRHVRAVIAQAR